MFFYLLFISVFIFICNILTLYISCSSTSNTTASWVSWTSLAWFLLWSVPWLRERWTTTKHNKGHGQNDRASISPAAWYTQQWLASVALVPGISALLLVTVLPHRSTFLVLASTATSCSEIVVKLQCSALILCSHWDPTTITLRTGGHRRTLQNFWTCSKVSQRWVE